MFKLFLQKKSGDTNKSTGLKSRRRPFLATLAGCTSAALLVACSSSSPVDAEAGEDAAEDSVAEFTFLSFLPMESLSMVPEMLGVSGGYFEKHGLDVTIEEVKGSPQAMQLVLSGAGDLTRVNAPDIYVAATDSQNVGLMNVATLVRGPNIKVLTSSENPIRSPEDFRGGLFGVPSEGGSSDKTLSLMLANAGIDPSEVERQVVGLTPGTYELVERGTLDGYMVSFDTAMVAERQNETAEIYPLGDSMSADTQAYVASQEGIDSNSENITTYLAAIKEALTDLVADEENDFENILETLRGHYDFPSLMDDEIAKAYLAEVADLYTNGGETELLITEEDKWIAGYEEMINAKLVDDVLEDPLAFVDNSLLP